MSQENLGLKAFTANSTIQMFELVSLVDGTTVLRCAADAVPVGVAQESVTVSGSHVTVKLLNSGGTMKIKAGAAIAAAAACYEGATGMMAASGDTVVGTALEAATASGDVIEVLVA